MWLAGLTGRSAGIRNVSYPDYLVYRDRATTLSGIAGFGGTAVALGGGEPQRVLAGLLWMPVAMQPLVTARGPDLLRDASQSWLHLVGRLRDRVTTEEADAEIGVMGGK